MSISILASSALVETKDSSAAGAFSAAAGAFSAGLAGLALGVAGADDEEPEEDPDEEDPEPEAGAGVAFFGSSFKYRKFDRNNR